MSIALELPRVSARSLADYAECQRLFALRYRANRYWPGPADVDADQEVQEHIRSGQIFHRMVQQHALGMDVTALLTGADGARLAKMWRMFEASPHARPRGTVWTEAPLHFALHGIPVLVRFDRLVKDGDDWEILDWKTGKQTRAKLEKSWQTRLYRFALAVAGHVYNDGALIPPDRIRMTYWDVNRGRPEEFAYDRATFEQDRAEFALLARAVMRPFDEQAPDDPFFPRTTMAGRCSRCRYDSYCNPKQRHQDPSAPRQLSLPIFTLETEAP